MTTEHCAPHWPQEAPQDDIVSDTMRAQCYCSIYLPSPNIAITTFAMSDVQALYQAFKDAAKSEPVVAKEKPKLALQQGTYRERISKHLGEFESSQIDKSVLKGCALHEMMLAGTWEAGRMLTPPRCSAESDFRAVKDLQRVGYAVETFPSIPTIVLIKVAVLLESIGVEYCFQPEIGALNRRKACGYFNQAINPEDGIIVAVDNLSPTEALRAEGLQNDSIPRLKSWSDVAFLQWKSRASETSDLKYIIRYNVMNFRTNSIVEVINFAHDRYTSQWPGHSYDVSSEEGQALLGTPNGSSVAYMLIQHKRELGHKTVEKITVFYREETLMLLFHTINMIPACHEQVQIDSS